jgi:hypothetical protein
VCCLKQNKNKRGQSKGEYLLMQLLNAGPAENKTGAV